MCRAEIRWLAAGPTLKLEGKVAGNWAAQARCLVSPDILPKGLIVDLTSVSYIDSAGEEVLKRLASVGALFLADAAYAASLCDRLGLTPMQRISERGEQHHASNSERSPIRECHLVEVS